MSHQIANPLIVNQLNVNHLIVIQLIVNQKLVVRMSINNSKLLNHSKLSAKSHSNLLNKPKLSKRLQATNRRNNKPINLTLINSLMKLFPYTKKLHNMNHLILFH